jgi:heptosyltransferase-2
MALDPPPLEDAAGAVVRQPPQVERLLLRAPNWLGDVVLSLGAVRDLRRNFPRARIEVLARPAVAELYRAVPQLDAVRESAGLRADVPALRGAFELAVLLPNSFASALSLWLARIPERWGYATDGRGLLLTRRARVPSGLRGASEVYYYRAMLAGLGLEVSASPDCTLACLPQWSDRGRSLLGEAGPWIGLNPGAFFGSAKRWLPERYAAVGDSLARSQDARVVVLGSAADRPLGEAVAAMMRTPARVLCGRTTLGELAGVLSQLELLVTNDSGPMHVAAALGVPLVAVFGPTDWRETAPVGNNHRLVREAVECAPCKLRVCPIDHRCMRRIDADRVADAALELLA